MPHLLHKQLLAGHIKSCSPQAGLSLVPKMLQGMICQLCCINRPYKDAQNRLLGGTRLAPHHELASVLNTIICYYCYDLLFRLLQALSSPTKKNIEDALHGGVEAAELTDILPSHLQPADARYMTCFALTQQKWYPYQ